MRTFYSTTEEKTYYLKENVEKQEVLKEGSVPDSVVQYYLKIEESGASTDNTVIFRVDYDTESQETGFVVVQDEVPEKVKEVEKEDVPDSVIQKLHSESK